MAHQIFGSFQGQNGIVYHNINDENVTAGDIWFDHANSDIKIYNSTSSAWVSVDKDGELALDYSKAAGLAVEQNLYAQAGQPALTVLAVGATTSGKVQGCSLGDGNVVEVYATGADYEAANVLYREFMSAGEPICFTGLNPGAIITSTQGWYGVGEQVTAAGQKSPMPLLSLGLSFNDSYVYAFRNSNQTPSFITGGTTGVSTGQVIIVNGALPSTVTFTRNGSNVQGQTPRDLDPWEITYFYTDANGEYFISATSKVMACVQAYMGDNPQQSATDTVDPDARFYDARLIMPLTNDGITWPRSGYVSAPYDGTESKYYVRDGVTGDFPTVNPGSPVDFDAATGASDQDYEPRGATRLRATGLVSAYSGADSAGLEATPLMPVSAMSQVVAQPFHVNDSGDGGNSGVAIASPYKGTAKIYEWDTTSNTAVLAYTVPLDRGTTGQGITPSTPEDQYIPNAGLVSNDAPGITDTCIIELVGQLDPGYVVADVPITVISQSAINTTTFTIRSQNGTTTQSIVTQGDETLMMGWTPQTKRAVVKEDADGYTRRLDIDNSGTVTYPLT